MQTPPIPCKLMLPTLCRVFPIIPRCACTLSYIPHCFADGHMFRKYSIAQCMAPDHVVDNRYCSFVISSNRPVSLEKYCIQMSSDSPLCMRAEIQVSVAAVERKSSTNYWIPGMDAKHPPALGLVASLVLLICWCRKGNKAMAHNLSFTFPQEFDEF